jgi:hypothetical protein
MPTRTLTLGIVALWLAALGWTAYRQWGREPEPPPLLDRTDEVGKQTARWDVRIKGDVIGHAQTALGRPQRDRLFALRAEFSFIPKFRFLGETITKLKSTYRATPRGQLRKLECEAAVGEHTATAQGEREDAGFRVAVTRTFPKGSYSEPGRTNLIAQVFAAQGLVSPGTASPVVPQTAVALGVAPFTTFAQESKQVRANGQPGGFNLLHPLHRLPGLYEGRQWEVMAIDPLTLARRRLDDPDSGVFALRATVATKEPWGKQKAPCWRVDFRKGGEIYAQVWVRLDDGLVVQQQVNCGGVNFDLIRESEDHAPAGKLPGLPLRNLVP